MARVDFKTSEMVEVMSLLLDLAAKLIPENKDLEGKKIGRKHSNFSNKVRLIETLNVYAKLEDIFYTDME